MLGKERRIALKQDAVTRSCASAIPGALADFHRGQPQALGMETEALRKALAPRLSAEAFQSVLRALADERKLELSGSTARLPGHNATSNPEDEKLWQAVLPALQKGGAAPPTVPELAAALKLKDATLKDFLHRKSRSGDPLRVTPDRFYPRATVAALAATAAEVAKASANGMFTAAQYRDATGTGRGLAIEILEFLDGLGHHPARRRRAQDAQGSRSHTGSRRAVQARRRGRRRGAAARHRRRRDGPHTQRRRYDRRRRAMATYDLIVIGEGIAGLTCANEAARAGLKVATFESNLFGGLVININELEGYPEGRQTSGAEFASELMEANAGLNVASVQEAVTAIAPSGGGFDVKTAGATHQARQVVVASGARMKKLGVPGEAEFEGRGVSQCADCDGPMFQDEEVAVVGGGDSALQEALVLARYCGKVHLLHRGERFRAQPHFVEQGVRDRRRSPSCGKPPWTRSSAARWSRKYASAARRTAQTQELPCAGVFACIGLEPNSEYLSPEVRRDERGFVVTGDALETSVPGIWAIGAVRSGYSGLLGRGGGSAARSEERRCALESVTVAVTRMVREY